MRGEQLKLFGAGDESNSRLKRRLIVIPLDTFILSGVVVFLLFILAFSLGVEKGRKISILSEDTVNLSEKNLQQENIKMAVQDSSPVNEQKITVGQISQKTTPQVRVLKIVDNKTEVAPAITSVKESYYIQLASYNKESFALEEAKKLKDKGFSAYTAKRGSFVVLYVGNFKTIAEAQKNMGLLKKNYKDCVLRRS